MLNRINQTLSARTNRLNLGTRSFVNANATATDVNNTGLTLRARLLDRDRHDRPHGGIMPSIPSPGPGGSWYPPSSGDSMLLGMVLGSLTAPSSPKRSSSLRPSPATLGDGSLGLPVLARVATRARSAAAEAARSAESEAMRSARKPGARGCWPSPTRQRPHQQVAVPGVQQFPSVGVRSDESRVEVG